jgi:hypothetical protein
MGGGNIPFGGESEIQSPNHVKFEQMNNFRHFKMNQMGNPSYNEYD